MEINILLGAGFSKAVFPAFPLMTELTEFALKDPEIVQLTKALDLPVSVFGQSSIPNYETWISVLEESSVYLNEPASIERRQYLVKCLGNVAFKKINEISKSLALSDSMIAQLETLIFSKSNIFTTNYDNILEYVVQDLIINKKIDVDSAYSLNSGLFELASQRLNQAYLGAGNTETTKYSRIFKLHGSCDWYSFSEDSSDKFWVDVSSLSNYMYPDRKKISADSIKMMTPIQALPGSSKTSTVSSNPMRRIWGEAYSAIKGKSGLAIYGSALNSRDTTLNSLLLEGLPRNTTFFVFDPYADEVKQNILKIIPDAQVSTFKTDNLIDFCNFLSSK